MKKSVYLFLIISVYLCSSLVNANEDIDSHRGHEHLVSEEHEEHGHGHQDGEEEHGHEKDGQGHEGDDDEHGHEESVETRIDPIIAETVGIKTAQVSSQKINQQVSSYGSLTTSPEQLSHVAARFPGLIQSVNVNIGDSVKKGTLLAKVESNDSLLTYSIKSPIAGTVIQRHANTGEFVSEQVLFSIANFDTLWAELRIYPTHRSQVVAGQHVEITINKQVIEGEIAHIIPVVNQPYQLARIKINNRKLGLSPGMLVEGNIVVDQFMANTVVVNEAIQMMEGKAGVFIHSGDSYTFAPLQIGRKDAHYTEVFSGITEGQEYVSQNSFLIKADIEKSEAEHAH